MSYKSKAFRKTSTGYELVTREYICSLDKAQQKIFIDKKKPFYLDPSDDGPKLTFNRKQKTFSFYGLRETGHQFFGSNENSATHQYCIEEIAKLNELSITANNNFANRKKGDVIKFTFKHAFPEIVIPIGENFIKPDLLLCFTEPHDLALRWNRILAIEVVVSHDLGGEKLELMANAKIPILRIKANKRWKRKKEYEMSKTERDELRTWIKNSFRKNYTGDFIMDRNLKSKTYLENETIQGLEKERKKLLSESRKQFESLSKLGSEYKRVKTEKNELVANNHRRAEIINQQSEKIQVLEGENQELLNNKARLNKLLLRLALILGSILSVESLIIYFYVIR